MVKMEYKDGVWMETWLKTSLIWKLMGFLIFVGGCSISNVKGFRV
jgi:hypothetical protein